MPDRFVEAVAALHGRAAEIVHAEVRRLSGRLPEMDGRSRGEIAHAVQRVADSLLSTPAERLTQLAGLPDGDSYASALGALFDLDTSPPRAEPSTGVRTAGGH